MAGLTAGAVVASSLSHDGQCSETPPLSCLVKLCCARMITPIAWLVAAKLPGGGDVAVLGWPLSKPGRRWGSRYQEELLPNRGPCWLVAMLDVTKGPAITGRHS